MALKWLFSPKTGEKKKSAGKSKQADERVLPASTANEAQSPTKPEVSGHHTNTQHVEGSGSSMGSEVVPSSVVVGVQESASTMSETDGRSMSSEEETQSSKDFKSYCDQVGGGRPSLAKTASQIEKKECAKTPRESSKGLSSGLTRPASCKNTEDSKSPNRLSSVIRKKLSVGGPAAEALKVSLVTPSNPESSSPPTESRKSPPADTMARSKSAVGLSYPANKEKKTEEVGCDSTTIPTGSMGNVTGATESKSRDHGPERAPRKPSLSPEGKMTKKKAASKDKLRRSSKEQSAEKSGPTVSPEVMKFYVDQLQTPRRKKELVRSIRGKRAEEEEAKRKQLSVKEMDEYMTNIKEVRMAKRQAKSRAIQEAVALQRADFLARLIHVSDSENKAANPVTPPPNTRI
ncbi:hypothetical protein FisN_2Lh542 [Fistulifera solaris]|uniref:Uncharacterized protein n=1 Tax=Fistulifera solaris TaxID=1519565 RepID=A0A1Z5JAI4_FISSO|nr:hypothetical protein FisN_2Lh542 [Fistulifera solaris]|eukprot:GAX11013.1 hypothetical protein FisN_2Lh542 [Fistulifera solaris]